jgi:MarR family transcriptional regulator, organic hydroperoxide resistance regulator
VEKSDLIKEIIYHHRLVDRFLRQNESDVWMDISLTINQVKALFFIANEGSVNFRKLAQAMKVTPSNVTGIIDRLVDQGLVTRTENPDDRRMLMLELTAKGDALIAKLRERRMSQMSLILDRMSTAELVNIAQTFVLLNKAIGDFEETP